MNIFYEYITLSMVLGNTQVASKIKTLTETHLADISSALLMTRVPKDWSKILQEVPIIVTQWERNVTNNATVSAIIVDIRGENWISRNLRPPSWKYDTKVVIVGDDEEREDIKESVNQLGICQVLLLTIQGNDIVETTFNETCRGIGSYTTSPRCRRNASFLDLPPNNIYSNGVLSGFEGEMIQTAAQKLGLELSFINQHETGYGQFDPPSGLFGDLSSGTSMAAFGALYPFHYRWLHTEMIFGCQTTSIAWSVPTAAGPTQPTWFIILVSEFSQTVWGFTLATFIGLIPVSILFEASPRDNILRPFHIFALILGVSQRLMFRKEFTTITIFFGFIVSAYYQAIMSSKLTVPMQVPEITNLQDLAFSGLTMTGPPTHKKVMVDVAEAKPDHFAMKTILKNYVVTQSTAEETFATMVKHRNIAYLRHAFNLNFIAEKSPETAGKIHIVEDAIATFIPSLLLPKNSCHAPKLQELYLKLCDSGLASKWLKDFTTKRRNSGSSGPTELNLDHIRGFLYLLLLGWLLSILAFVIEKLVKIFTSNYNKKRQVIPYNVNKRNNVYSVKPK